MRATAVVFKFHARLVQAALLAIKKADIVEVKSMVSPPSPVRLVMQVGAPSTSLWLLY